MPKFDEIKGMPGGGYVCEFSIKEKWYFGFISDDILPQPTVMIYPAKMSGDPDLETILYMEEAPKVSKEALMSAMLDFAVKGKSAA